MRRIAGAGLWLLAAGLLLLAGPADAARGPLRPCIFETILPGDPIKAQHLNELRACFDEHWLDWRRVHCGEWTDDPIVAGVTPVKAVHVNELRACLNRFRAVWWNDWDCNSHGWTGSFVSAGDVITKSPLFDVQVCLYDTRTWWPGVETLIGETVFYTYTWTDYGQKVCFSGTSLPAPYKWEIRFESESVIYIRTSDIFPWRRVNLRWSYVRGTEKTGEVRFPPDRNGSRLVIAMTYNNPIYGLFIETQTDRDGCTLERCGRFEIDKITF